MCSTKNSGLGAKSQLSLDNLTASNNELENTAKPPLYHPSEKHEKYGWGSINPIENINEGQFLLDTGYKEGKQIYNVTSKGKIVKFQPDNSPDNGYHAYEVNKPRDISNNILKKMEADGKITKSQANKLRKGKSKKK